MLGTVLDDRKRTKEKNGTKKFCLNGASPFSRVKTNIKARKHTQENECLLITQYINYTEGGNAGTMEEDHSLQHCKPQ